METTGDRDGQIEVGTQKLGLCRCPANLVIYHRYQETRRMLVTRLTTIAFIILAKVLVLLQIVTLFVNAITNSINA
jgi:hypothetical protein